MPEKKHLQNYNCKEASSQQTEENIGLNDLITASKYNPKQILSIHFFSLFFLSLSFSLQLQIFLVELITFVGYFFNRKIDKKKQTQNANTKYILFSFFLEQSYKFKHLKCSLKSIIVFLFSNNILILYVFKLFCINYTVSDLRVLTVLILALLFSS